MGSYDNTTVQAEAVRDSQLPEVQTALFHAAEELLKLTSRLGDRLDVVMRPTPAEPQPYNGSEVHTSNVPTMPRAPMANSMWEIHERLASAARRLDDYLQRLEV